MEISGILTVDGYIKANSYDTTSTVYNGASGGSGGSIEINTGNFSGEFLAFIPLNSVLPCYHTQRQEEIGKKTIFLAS